MSWYFAMEKFETMIICPTLVYLCEYNWEISVVFFYSIGSD